MGFLTIVTVFVLWLCLLYRLRESRALPFVATLPLWGPFAVYIMVMMPEWLSYL